MRQTFTLRSNAGSGLYGPTYVDYPSKTCRFVRATKLIKKPTGEEITSNAFIRTAAAVNADDIIIVGDFMYNIATISDVAGVGGGIIEREIRLSGEMPTSGTTEETDMLKSVYDTDNDGIVDKAEGIPVLLALPVDLSGFAVGDQFMVGNKKYTITDE